ncbi:STAS domain-containing protein [Nitrogeniibacter mangrovi]|uniref:STAS domain-containing protein n=1 Tax=Nitrogeniibacter mangrovi TaxID=2016596 RepID=A0A6C1B518_9RHOO|nr:STAS domain-containing protein [Nitrogeniibacter mangrovi]QID18782.1 STAS domain-containing protein [Nitrogeniibacter mangrovi]
MNATSSWVPRGALTLQTVAALRAAAADAVGRSPQVDLSGVTEADSAALALLIELARGVRAGGQTLQVRGMPAGLAALADLYGVSELLKSTDA